MSKIKSFGLYIFGFVLFYYPNLLPSVNPYIFPIILLLFFMLLDLPSKKIFVFDFSRKDVIFKFILGITFSAIYYALICALKSSSFSIKDLRIVQSLIFIVYMWLVLYLLRLLYNRNNDVDSNMEFLFKLASIQGIICLAMIIFPSLKSISNYLFVADSSFTENSYILTTRIYGISNSYTYGLPIFHGMLAGLCYYYSINKDKKYFKYLPFIILVVILNGRTGLLISIILIILSTIFSKFKYKNNSKMFFSFLKILVFCVLFYLLLDFILPNITQFIRIMFNEIYYWLTTGEFTGTSKYLFEDKISFPSGLGLIFGEGFRPYTMVGNPIKTDIGFVNDLYMGGLIYLSLLYFSYFRLLFFKTSKDYNLLFKFLILIAILIGNWKGEIFRNSTFIIGLLFITLNWIMGSKERENN